MNTGPVPEEVLATLRDEHDLLGQLRELLESQRVALMRSESRDVEAVAGEMLKRLQSLETAANQLRALVTASRYQSLPDLARGWPEPSQQILAEVISDIKATVLQLSAYGEVNAALASQGLLLARYCLKLLSPERYRPYEGASTGRPDMVVSPSVLSRRG